MNVPLLNAKTFTDRSEYKALTNYIQRWGAMMTPTQRCMEKKLDKNITQKYKCNPKKEIKEN